MQQRPAFELQPYEDEHVPFGVHFTDSAQLIGHKIKVVHDYPQGELAYGAELVIVTETHCWLVLRPETHGCEDGANILVVGDSYATRRSGGDQLSDYLTADEMRQYGLVNTGEYELLKAKEDKRLTAEKLRKAEGLRKQLEALSD